MRTGIYFMIIALVSLSSCYNPKVKSLENELSTKNAQVTQLEKQIDHMQQTNSSLLDRLAQLSVINQTEAESIKNSLESMNRQQEYIAELAEIIEEKDSINDALVYNLRNSLIDFHDEDVDIEVRGSAVYVSISDKLLFNTGSSQILPKANGVLEKVSRIINDNGQLNVLVEGHTDNLPIANSKYQDNWDLSALRATAVVRKLEQDFFITPGRLTASGRGEHLPKADNRSQVGRSINRRTEIILTPKLDQFFDLLKEPELVG
jgi:chemotaxis protein MotB